MPYPYSLATFTPSGGSAVDLGTEDCWIKVTREETLVRYVVQGTFVRNDPSDLPTNTTAAQRLSAEEYFQQLVADLGGIVPTKNINIDNESIQTYHPQYVSGTLDNPYTGLSATDVYLVDASMDDQGGRSYDITLVFVKPATEPESDNLITFNAINVGNRNGWITVNYQEGRTVVNVATSYQAPDRATAETYAFGLASSLGVRPFDSRDGQLVPRGGAVKGTLTNNDTGYVLADCYCIGYRSQDEGFNSYTITLTFSTPDSPELDPANDGIARWKLDSDVSYTDLGNIQSELIINKDTAFEVFIVRASYNGPNFRFYSQTLSTPLGPNLVKRVKLPNGDGVLKNPCGEEGTLQLFGQSYSNLWFEDIDYDYNEDRVDMTITFVRLS